MERLQETLCQDIDQQMLFIRYGDICNCSGLEIEYLILIYFSIFASHEFNHVEQITIEENEMYGVFDDHQTRLKLERQVSQALAVFVPELCDWIRQRYGWFYERFGF